MKSGPHKVCTEPALQARIDVGSCITAGKEWWILGKFHHFISQHLLSKASYTPVPEHDIAWMDAYNPVVEQ